MSGSEIRKSRLMRLVEYEQGGEPVELLIRRRLQDGMTVRELAQEFGIHFTMLYEWLVALKIPAPTRAPRDYSVPGSRK